MPSKRQGPGDPSTTSTTTTTNSTSSTTSLSSTDPATQTSTTTSSSGSSSVLSFTTSSSQSSDTTTTTTSSTSTSTSSSSSSSLTDSPLSSSSGPPSTTSLLTLSSSTTFTHTTFTSPDTPTTTPNQGVNNNVSTHNGFFNNKGEVAGVFSVVGLVAVVLLVCFATNVVRRRRAKKFDDEVASAAAAAFADADRGPAWMEDEEDRWRQGPSRAYTNSSADDTSGSHGAYHGAPMPVTYPQANYEEYGMNQLSHPMQPTMQARPYYDSNPFGDVASAGLAGVGAAAAAGRLSPPNQMRYRAVGRPDGSTQLDQFNIGSVQNGMQYDSGPYPVPPARSRSIRQAQNQQPLYASSSNSSGDHSHTGTGSVPSSQSIVSGPQREVLPSTLEADQEDPYDGFTPESENSSPKFGNQAYGSDETPRVLRVANV